MPNTAVTLVLLSMATAALAESPTSNPLYGKWTWTLKEKNCTEVYDYRTDNTSLVTSGEEVGESRFTISEGPDANGFYRMTDVVTKSNGKIGCDGEPGGTPVGDTATVFLFFNPAKTQMMLCMSPSPDACIGPYQRLTD